jgi:hypothetical protein
MEYLLIVSIIFICVGIWLFHKLEFEFIGFMLQGIGYLSLVVILLTIPIGYYGNEGKIQEFQSVQYTVDIARENRDIESAALQLKVAECNQWLASKKYWNNTWIFDVCIPDEINKLNPIK